MSTRRAAASTTTQSRALLTRPKEAEAAYRKAIELNPKSAVPWNGLGNVLMQHLDRVPEAETAFRRSLEIKSDFPFAWNGLGALMHRYLKRPDDAEAAYRKAIEFNPNFAYSWAGLADLIGSDRKRHIEARAAAVTALTLKPDLTYAQIVFVCSCGRATDELQSALPKLLIWCDTHSDKRDVLDFTLTGFIRFARLTAPAEALALLDSVPAAASGRFETLRDALLAHADRAHLDGLAPERRVVAIELLNRMIEKAPGAHLSERAR